MPDRLPVPVSPAFEDVAAGAPFRDRIVVVVRASPEAVFEALRTVTVRDMKLAWLLGELRYLPSRLAGRMPTADSLRPFLHTLIEGGTLVLQDDVPREIITGSAGVLHRVDQDPQHFASRGAFEAFDNPGYDKLFMSLRVAPTGRPGEHWLILEHATRPLSPLAARQFARYWRVIKPGGAFVTWQLLQAIRRRAERMAERRESTRPVVWRPVRATPEERRRVLPGDALIPHAMDVLTHAVTIRRPPGEVWPWLAQMGAGSRAGWYSYDWLDNGRQPSARIIVPALQQPSVGTVFPALPGMTDGFTLLAIEPERALTLGFLGPDGTPVVTWTFVLDEVAPDTTRLVVRARAGPAYRFLGLPVPLTKLAARIVHFVMQRKQLVEIAKRVEGPRGADAVSPREKRTGWPSHPSPGSIRR